MPTTTHKSRRAVLAGAAAVAATPLATLPALTAAHPDAELLALGREMEEAQQVVRALDERCRADALDLPEEFAAACDDRRAVSEEILATHAKTVDGLRVKVTAIEYVSGFPDEAGEVEPDEWRSLADDIRRLAGKGVRS
jgi:hypothetical protein